MEGLIPRKETREPKAGETITVTESRRKGVLQGILGALGKSAQRFLSEITTNMVTFVKLTEEQGLKKALDLFLGGALKRQSLESLYESSNDIAELVIKKLETDAKSVTFNGQEALEVTFEGRPASPLISCNL